MFILAVKGFEEDGAFSLENDDGDKVLLMFEEEDDAPLQTSEALYLHHHSQERLSLIHI